MPSARALARRLERVLAEVRRQGAPALVTWTPENVGYLTGFIAVSSTRPVVFLAADNPVLVVPELEADHARTAWAGEVVTYGDDEVDTAAGCTHLDLAIRAVVAAARRAGASRVAFEVHSASYAAVRVLMERLDGAVPVGPVVEWARMRKDDEELAVMRRAASLLPGVMRVHMALSHPGISEVQLGYEAAARSLSSMAEEAQARLEVWTRPVAGLRSALPHARPSTYRLSRGDVVLHSVGLRLDGYWVGLERTCVLGEPCEPVRRAFRVMVEAQARAIEAVRAGVRADAVHAAARAVLEGAGYRVGHRTGHGIGLAVHEPPSLGAGEVLELEPGMVVSIEPGVYLPGIGGFRHADNVLVTERGAEPLSHFPRSLEELTLDV